MVWWDAGRLVNGHVVFPDLAHGWLYLCLLANRTRQNEEAVCRAHFFDCICFSASHCAFDDLGITRHARLNLETSKSQYAHPRYLQTACCFRWSALFHSCGEWTAHAGLVQSPFSRTFLCTFVCAVQSWIAAWTARLSGVDRALL